MDKQLEHPSRATAEAVARQSYGKLVAFLAARTGDVGGAEDALSEAFARALEAWPVSGIPRVPEAWLLTVARRKMIDAARQRIHAQRAQFDLQQISDEIDGAAAEQEAIPDERLALMFCCAHPAIDAAVRAPLMLQAVLGLDAGTIASAFLTSPGAMGQRLVRAKMRIRETGIGLRVPAPEELSERLDGVLEAIYAAFTEGWSDPAGTEARQRDLVDESLWLGRLVVALLPEQPEALGLLALMLHAHARRSARRDAEGAYVALAQQDPGRWDAALVEEAESWLRQASVAKRPGRFQLEAAVQSVHAARRLSGVTDWSAIVQIYDALLVLVDSPVIAINRAVALSETEGPRAGLEALDLLVGDRRLAEYQAYWAARAELLVRTHQPEAADAAYERAIGLESDPAVRSFLQKRRAASSAIRRATASPEPAPPEAPAPTGS
jgi:RNA polymerase sigma-70 factor (ECF subfamily)